MPYPIALAVAAAATAASTGMQMSAQGKTRNATERASQAELLRQADYQKQSLDVANQSLADANRSTADEQIAQGADARTAAYQRITAQPSAAPSTPLPVNRMVANPTPTAGAQQQSNALTAAWNRIVGGAQARLGGYQDWNLTQNIKNRRAGEKLGQIGQNARGSANVLQAELQDASHAGDGLNTLAGALSALGSVAGAYGSVTPAAGAAAGAGAPVTVTPGYGWGSYMP